MEGRLMVPAIQAAAKPSADPHSPQRSTELRLYGDSAVLTALLSGQQRRPITSRRLCCRASG
jgi:hypothetical protein